MHQILFYTNLSPYDGLPVGGAETSLRLLAESFAAQGFEVCFVTSTKKKSWLGHRWLNVNGVDVLEYSRFSMGLLNRYRAKRFFKTVRRTHLMQLLKKRNVKIVHTYYNLAICKLFLELKEEAKFKLIVRMAGLRPFELMEQQPELKSEFNHVFQKADLLNFISEGLKVHYQNYFSLESVHIPDHRIFVSDIGIDLKQLDAKWHTPLSNEPFRLLMVGRFTDYQKRQDILIEALKHLEFEWEMIFVGTGPNRGKIEQLARELPSNRLRFIDYLSQADLWKLMGQVHLLCHACDYEGLSKTILESMAVGLPVLASDVMPLNQYIQDGSNGFLVANDPKQWAQKLRSIHAKEDLSSISSNGRTMIEERYDASKNIQLYLQQTLQLITDEDRPI